MQAIISSILEILVMFLALIIMRYAIPYCKMKLVGIIDETTWKIIKKEVRSVEQTIVGSNKGIIKKEEVAIRIASWAHKHGITITETQIFNLIEAAVYAMKYEREKDG